MQTKQEIKLKLQPILKEWLEEIKTALRDTTDSYDTIAKSAGTTTQYIYRLATKHGLRRVADKPVAQDQEVSNV